jgi:hypothetical protein
MAISAHDRGIPSLYRTELSTQPFQGCAVGTPATQGGPQKTRPTLGFAPRPRWGRQTLLTPSGKPVTLVTIGQPPHYFDTPQRRPLCGCKRGTCSIL